MDRTPPREPGHAGAGQLQRHRARPGVPRPRGRRVVPADRARPGRLGGPPDRAAGRRGDPSRHRLRRRRGSCLARGRLHAVRGRRDRTGDAGSAVPGDDRGEQRADVAVDAAGRGGGDTGRAAAALPPRLLQLRGPAPLGVAAQHPADAPVRRHGHDGARRRHRHRDVRRPGRRRGRRRGGGAGVGGRARGCCRGRGEGEPRRPRGAPVAAGRGLPLRPRRLVARGRPAGRLLRPAGRRAHRRDPGPGLPHQRRTLLLQGIRQARGRRDPRKGTRRRVDGSRLRADGLGGRELLPHRSLPLRRGGPRPRRPPRHRGHRRDRRGRAQPAARRRDDRCGQAADVLRRHHQRGIT